jgi:hypothetical protein
VSFLRASSSPVISGLAAPVFGDDAWDLSGARLPARVNAADAWVRFEVISDAHWRLLAKEYIWARLNEPVEGSRLLPPQSARVEFTGFSLFCRWMLDPAAHPAPFRPRLSELRHADLDAFVQALRDGYSGGPLSTGTMGIYLRVVERLHDYSAFFSHDRLAIHPWRHRPSSRVAGTVKSPENKTPRIPLEVLAPFLRWALFFVEVASRDILAGLAEAERLRSRVDLLPSDAALAGRFEEWIAARRAQGRGIPARGRVSDPRDCGANYNTIVAESGLPQGYLRRPEVRRWLADAVAELGLDDDRACAVQFRPLPWTTHAKPDVLARLADYIDGRRVAGRGIPCWSEVNVDIDGKPNLALIAGQLGVACIQEHHNPEAFEMMDRALADLGGEPGGMDTPISIDPETGRPWRARFGPNSVLAEAEHLRAACYVVSAYLSGMRDGEIMEIRPGAARLERSADGVVNRHRVASVVSKGRRTPEPATWVVSEHVATAIEVMERLDGAARLFERFSLRTDRINQLRDHVNRLSAGEAAIAVPDVDGRPWRFDTRQFRRTLAWFIGSQPFGVWAGAVQFKHRSVRSAMEGIGPAVFEGYMGTTPSGFPAEVDLAKRAAADLYVDNLAATHAAGAASGGPGAARINAQLEELRGEAEEHREDSAPPRAVDGARRTAMLRNVSRNLFVGPLTDCFFDPDVALCLRDRDRSKADAPIVGRCQPDRCRNSRIGEHHLPEWEERLAQVRRDLRTRGLPPIQRKHLADQRDRLVDAIAGVRRACEEGT